MILLDTNVLSELMRPAPEPCVLDWLDQQPSSRVWVCAVTRAEIEVGIQLLPEGRRRLNLHSVAQAMFDEDFAQHCLPFCQDAAIRYAQIVSVRTKMGHPISVEDAQIASIALLHNLNLATRNIRDFVDVPFLNLINPWDY